MTMQLTVASPRVGSRPRLICRALMPLLVALGLTLMHGGIGQAAVCHDMSGMSSGMTGSAPMPATGTEASTTAGRLSAEHAHHHQPSLPPLTAHGADMCMAEPVSASGGGPKPSPQSITLAGPPAAVSVVGSPPTMTLARGQIPPAPDVVSVLCVNRR